MCHLVVLDNLYPVALLCNKVLTTSNLFQQVEICPRQMPLWCMPHFQGTQELLKSITIISITTQVILFLQNRSRLTSLWTSLKLVSQQPKTRCKGSLSSESLTKTHSWVVVIRALPKLIGISGTNLSCHQSAKETLLSKRASVIQFWCVAPWTKIKER